MIYQSVNPSFNPDVEYMKAPLSRGIPSVDNSLFIIARRLILGYEELQKDVATVTSFLY